MMPTDFTLSLWERDESVTLRRSDRGPAVEEELSASEKHDRQRTLRLSARQGRHGTRPSKHSCAQRRPAPPAPGAKANCAFRPDTFAARPAARSVLGSRAGAELRRAPCSEADRL